MILASNPQIFAGIRFFGLRVENGVVGDLLSIGDDQQYFINTMGLSTPYPGSVGPMTIAGFLGNGATVFASTIGLHTPPGGHSPMGIHLQGSINTGQGPGINIASGTEISVDVATIHPVPGILIGAAAGKGIEISPVTAFDLQVGRPNPIINMSEQLRINTPQSFFGGPTGAPNAGTYYLQASGAGGSSVRLTSDGNAANSGNCLNVPTTNTANISINLAVIDRQNRANTYSVTLPFAVLSRPSTASSTQLVYPGSEVPYTATSGSLSFTIPSITADTVNGCINLTIALPTSGTDTFDVTATVPFVFAN